MRQMRDQSNNQLKGMPSKRELLANRRAHRHDRTKLVFNGKHYGKGRLVLSVVRQYVADYPNVTYSQLKRVFPDQLHSLGIVQPVTTAKRWSRGHRRFFISDPIRVKDMVIAVCSDFGINNIGKFITHVHKHVGYRVKVDS